MLTDKEIKILKLAKEILKNSSDSSDTDFSDIEHKKDQVIEKTNNILQNVKILRILLSSAAVLRTIIELEKNKEKSIDDFSLTKILVGILIICEEEGSIKIIEEEE